jgi:magnesium-transporting ATPase (P-type)
LARDGPNRLPLAPGTPAWRELLGQLGHFFALMLWVAALLALVAGMPQLSVAIALVIVLNGVFAFVQEYRAERAAAKLRDLLPRRVVVVRDGRPLEIDAAELVVDDVVVLDAGDRVSADMVLTTAHGLTVDTSTLTGESVPSALDAGMTVYGGTFVVEGAGTAVVQATGARTRLASIAAMTRSTQRAPGPLARELHRVVLTIAMVAVAVGTTFLGISLLVGSDFEDAALFAIGVTVALVPEGLLPTVTLSLAIGAQRMSHQHALVRRLEAVETLGSTTFICTDKTGTLTENRMAVVEAWTPDGIVRVRGEGYEPTATVDGEPGACRAATALALAGVRASTGRAVTRDGAWVALGDPMEAALDAFARRLGADVTADATASPVRFPFDPRRRRMSVVVDDQVLVKGAPDAMFGACTGVPTDAERVVADMAARGLRTIAVAHRRADQRVPSNALQAERDLTLLGVVGIEDPPRAHAAAAVASCRRAGMKVAMVTGDHPATAAAIAREVGLLGGDGPVLQGDDLPADDEVLGALVDRDGIVVARVAPEQKLRIARALRSRGHVVAMTGDGVNDGPALQEADIGVAMGRSGTDVAREAADLVLLDDDFATIVTAVEQGRAVFSNVRRFLTYHLADNVAELTPFVFWALSGGRFPLALGVLQILALDIGTDTLPAVALGAELPDARTLDQPPARGRLLDGLVARRAFGVLGPTEAAIAMFAFVTTFLASGWVPGDRFPGGATLLAASGSAFAAVVLGQMANAFACRSVSRPVWALQARPPNRLLHAAVALELVALVLFLGVAPVADALEHARPTLAGLAVALLAPVSVLAVDAVDKRWRTARRHAARR